MTLYNEESGKKEMTLPPEVLEILKKIAEDEDPNSPKAKAEKWISNIGVKRRIEMYGKNTDINRPKKKLKFEIAAGGGSYTDGHSVRVALADDWFDKGEAHWVRFMKFVTAHELGHINWSDFRIFRELQQRAERHFEDKHGIKGAGRFAGDMLNITEDGRIERAQANVMPGLLKYIMYVNGMRYESFDGAQLGIVPLHDFRNVSLTLSKSGLLPKGYNKRIKGTKTDDAIKKAMPLIVQAIRSETAKECADLTWQIIMENEAFLVEAMQEFEIDEDMMKDMLSEDMSDEDGDGSEGQGGSPMEMDGDQGGDGEGSASGGSSENSEDDGAGSGEGEDSSSADGEGDDDASGSGGKGEKTGKKVTIKPLGGMDGEADYSNNPAMRKAPQGDVSVHFGDESDLEKGEAGEGQAKMVQKGKEGEEGDMGSALDEIIVNTENESLDFLDKAKDIAKRENKRMERESLERAKSEIGKKEVNGVLSEYAGHMDFEYVNEQVADNGPISEVIMRRGRGLRRDLKEIFNDKKGWSLMNQRSGMLDENQLYRAGSGLQQSDVFIKKQIPEDTNWVVSVLVDNSGSMSGRVTDESGKNLGAKTTVARHASTVLEIALNGLVPFKIARFDTSWSGRGCVCHAQVRGWEQRTKDILSWNSTDSAGRGNADAMSIGVATQELLKRPEHKKLLIVMSDGLPAENTPAQVKAAVEDARKNGVKVVAIGFGPEYELERNAKTYHEMYDKDVVLTMPDGLSKELVKILRQTIARGG